MGEFEIFGMQFETSFGILVVGLIISIMFTLYAIALLSRKFRLVEEELKRISEDNNLLNESVKIVQSQLSHNSSHPAQQSGIGESLDLGETIE